MPETQTPRPAPSGRRRETVLRAAAALVIVAASIAAYAVTREAREITDVSRAVEHLASGDAAAASRLLAVHGSPRARAGRALAQALQGGGPERCDCTAGDMAYFHPALVVEDALRRGQPEAALRVAQLARDSGGAAAGVWLAAALVELGRDDEARQALAAVPEPQRLAGPGREVARVLDLRAGGATGIVRDRRRRPAGSLDAAGSFHPEANAAALVPPAAAADVASAEPAPALRLAADLILSRLAQDALGPYRGSIVLLDLASGDVLAAVSDGRSAAAGGTPAFDERREPASIAKIVTAAAALRAGLDPDAEIAHMSCEGFARYGSGTLWCASPGGRLQGLAHALAISCNVAFANLGLRVGQPALVDEFRRWGFDGGGRGDGRIVAVPEGELALAKMAVGLDATDITPLHAARLAAVTAGGTMPVPVLVTAADGALGLSPRGLPHPAAKPVLEARAAGILRDALKAVTEPGGTAAGVAPPGFPIAMKTGTASAPGVGYHVNYVGIGPLPHPTLAFCVRVTGQPTSVHVTRAGREVLAALLDRLAARLPSPAPATD